jgi:hypothetical protein
MSGDRVIGNLPSGHTLVEENGHTYESTLSKQCGPGEILREGYTRHGYSRKPFTRADGTVVRGSNVTTTKVAAVCIPSRGNRHIKTLPKPTKGELERFGYKMDLPDNTRHASLKRAADELGTLSTLRHVNLIRNYFSHEGANGQHYKVLTDDLTFLENLYGRQRAINGPTPRKSSGKSSRKSSKKSSTKSQRGGDTTVYPTTYQMTTSTGAPVQIVSVVNANGSVSPVIVANDHVKINDATFQIKTLDETSSAMIAAFKREHNPFAPNVSASEIATAMQSEDFIGLFKDGQLKAFAEVHLLSAAHTLQIVCIECDRSDHKFMCAKLLFKYICTQLTPLGVTKSFIDLNLTHAESLHKMNCYIKCGFKATDFNADNNTIRLMCVHNKN